MYFKCYFFLIKLIHIHAEISCNTEKYEEENLRKSKSYQNFLNQSLITQHFSKLVCNYTEDAYTRFHALATHLHI